MHTLSYVPVDMRVLQGKLDGATDGAQRALLCNRSHCSLNAVSVATDGPRRCPLAVC